MINSFILAFKSLCNWIAKYGSVGFAFSLPLHKLATSYALAIWFLFTIFHFFIGGYSFNKIKSSFNNSRPILLLIALYLVLVLGLINSENIDEGMSKIAISIPFIIAPVLFLFNKDLIEVRVIVKAFFVGLFLSIILSFISLIINGYLTLDSFYADFDLFHHSSYFSMLINIALVLLLFLHEKIKLSIIMRFIVVVFLSGLIFLISSKAGVLVLIALFFIKAIQVIKSSSALYPKLFFLSFLIIFSVLLIQNKRVQNMVLNFENIINQDTPIYPTESTAIRWKIWEKSFDLITESFVLGYGSGDANDQLMKAYNEEPYLLRHIIKKKYNAHNTFFQLWIMIGLMGPLILLALLLSILIRHRYSFFSIGVVLIFVINFSLESMLERHAGVMIFSFFISLIIVCKDSSFFLNKQLH